MWKRVCIHMWRNDYHKRQVRINGYLWERTITSGREFRLLDNLQCSIFGVGRFFYGCLLNNYSFQCTFTLYATFCIFIILHNLKNIKKKKNPGPSYRTPLKHPLRACVLHLIRDDIKSIHPFVKAIGTGYPHSFIIEFLEREARAGSGPTSSAISLKVAKDSCSSPSKHRNQWTECYLPLHSRFYHQFFPSPGFWQKKKKKKKFFE